jgi:hypothetical protein
MKPASRLALLALLLLAALLLGVGVGAVPLGPAAVLGALAGSGEDATLTIVRDLRSPRVVLAALVGAGLAASGATFQALLRNPLAEPYILGVSGGAAVGAVGAILLGLSATAWAVPIAAFAGAILAIVLVLRVAVSVGGAMDTRVLLLSGVVVGAFFNACILLALTFSDTESFRSAIFWMMGSFSGATWGASSMLALYLARDPAADRARAAAQPPLHRRGHRGVPRNLRRTDQAARLRHGVAARRRRGRRERCDRVRGSHRAACDPDRVGERLPLPDPRLRPAGRGVPRHGRRARAHRGLAQRDPDRRRHRVHRGAVLPLAPAAEGG